MLISHQDSFDSSHSLTIDVSIPEDEIRNQIYGYLLSTKHTKVDVTGEPSVSVILLTPLAVLFGER